MKFYKWLLLTYIAAALQILSLSPLNFYWLSFVFAVPLFFFLEKENRLWALFLGFFIYRFLAMTGIVYFVFDPIMFTASIIIFLGLPLSFWLFKKANPKLALLLLPLLWPFWDYLSARYTALPNFVMMAGNALGKSPFLGLASFWGLIALTFFIAVVNLVIYAAIKNYKHKRKTFLALTALTTAVLLAGQLASAAMLRRNLNTYESQSQSEEVVLVSEKNGLDSVFKDKNLSGAELERLINENLNDLERHLRGNAFDLLVLPDSMFDVDYDTSVDQEAFSKFGITNDGYVINGYRQMSRALSVNLIVSAEVAKGDKRYSALLLFDRNGDLLDVFYKKYLAITGEFWPFGKWHPFYFDWLLKSDPDKYENYPIFKPEDSLYAGETKVLQVGDLTAAPAICLEIHYPAEMERRVALGAKAILNPSSNLWADASDLTQYIGITNNLRRIESVWLKVPVLVNGRREPPDAIFPSGELVGPGLRTIESGDYEIFRVKLKF